MTLPDVPDTFTWTQTPTGAVLTCVPLAEIAIHAFTTRAFELPSKEAWPGLGPLVGTDPSRVVGLNQVHGRDVVVVDRDIDSSALHALQQQPASADALVSNATDVALVIRAADCVPLLMAVQMPPPGVVHWPHRTKFWIPGSVLRKLVDSALGVGVNPSKEPWYRFTRWT